MNWEVFFTIFFGFGGLIYGVGVVWRIIDSVKWRPPPLLAERIVVDPREKGLGYLAWYWRNNPFGLVLIGTMFIVSEVLGNLFAFGGTLLVHLGFSVGFLALSIIGLISLEREKVIYKVGK